MSFIKVQFNQFLRDLEKADTSRLSAGISAAKAEGYAIWKAMRSEVRAGAPGGVPLLPLREISQWMRRHKADHAFRLAGLRQKSAFGQLRPNLQQIFRVHLVRAPQRVVKLL